ncbi:MAG: hypothetical protein KGJ55_07740 [Gammaproteobacteria bacterium]|nr:hypothetical protein [Gammaproteobacteria bacterium]
MRSRLQQLIRLVERQDGNLLAVRRRLLGDECDVDAQRLRALLAEDIGIDRLESFGAKFARMQDTVADKLVPALLRAAGEPVQAAIDNLSRMERLGLIASADRWLQMRGLRNRLVHEYIDRPDDLAPALETACRFTERMHEGFYAMREYAAAHLHITFSADESAK